VTTARPAPVPLGEMALYDSCAPALPPGDYAMTLTTTVSGLRSEHGSQPERMTKSYAADNLYVSVASPALTATDVVMVHPPANTTGDYSLELPHVVLRRPSLPWEGRAKPWLALLVLGPGLPIAGGVVTIGDTGVLPQAQDLPYLCHVRAVGASGPGPREGNGLFSVVVANRLPPDAGPATACLVSLENTDLARIKPGGTLPLLYSWNFTVSKQGNLKQAMQEVGTNALPLALSRQRLASLSGAHRDGSTGVAHYHGPVLGQAPAATTLSPLVAQIAGELGRQLAAADRSLLRQLYDWHRQDQLASVAGHADGQPGPALPGPRAEPDDQRVLGSSKAVVSMALPQVVPLARPAPHRRALGGKPSPAGGGDVGPEPGEAGTVTRPPPPPAVQAYLQALCKLENIPLAYLVPGPTLLPLESVRFFFLDADWLAEVAAGTLNVFGVDRRARAFAAHQGPVMRTSLPRAGAPGGGPGAATTPGADGSTVVSGFLMRSAVLAQWPQAQVSAFVSPLPDQDALAGDPTVQPVPPLRLQKLSDNLMIGLYPAAIAALWVEQPHYSLPLALGQATGDVATYPHGCPNLGGLPVPTRSGDNRTLDMAAIASALGATGSAALASYLVHPPYRQVFTQADQVFTQAGQP
jgi:hypothetical protein